MKFSREIPLYVYTGYYSLICILEKLLPKSTMAAEVILNLRIRVGLSPSTKN